MTVCYVYVNGPQKLDEAPIANSVFVAHGFFGGDDRKIDDYRQPFRDVLKKKSYRAVFPDEEARPGTLLSTICQHIINTELGIYDVTNYNANVLIELGLALGLNRPILVIAKEDNKPLLPFLEELQPLRYASYPKLAKSLLSEVEQRLHTATEGLIGANYCASCLRHCPFARKRIVQAQDEFALIGVDEDANEDLHYNFMETIQRFDLIQHQPVFEEPKLTICTWIRRLRQSKIAVFYVTEPYHGEQNASTHLQLGIASGLGTPWTMILPSEKMPPWDLQGLFYVSFGSYHAGFRKALSNSIRGLLATRLSNPGIYSALPYIDLEAYDEESIKLATESMVANGAESSASPFIRLNYREAGQGAEQSFIASKGEKIIIGRSEKSNLKLINDKSVSRTHAMLYTTVDNWVVTDLHSAGGVSLNEKSIEPNTQTIVYHNDVLIIGRTRLIIELEEYAEKQMSQDSVPVNRYVMAVDDDPEVRITLGRVLEREGFEVGLAESGEQALSMLAQRVPDALILDILMPGMDGIQLCRSLRREARYRDLPIMFVTAKGSTDDIVEGMDAGADDYVVKPFEFAELRARLYGLLRRSYR